jgi:solute carrier family 35 protein C2
MVKASTPIFVLTWAYLLGIERITWSLLGVVLVIALGEFLTVAGEVHFNMIGFIMCLSASLLSGARWTLVQLKLHTLDPPLKTTIATMRVLSPSMFFSMLLLSLCIERPWISLSSGYFGTVGEALRTFGMGMIGATFAVAMIICEFYLIMRANAIVLMIGGVIKEMITIIVGVEFFHDSLNRVNVAGCLIVFSGVLLYKVSYHLDKHGKGSEEDGRVRYEHVENGEQQQNGWIESVDGKILDGDVEKTSFEMESVGIQMGLPTVHAQDLSGDSDDDYESSDSDNGESIRHRIT